MMATIQTTSDSNFTLDSRGSCQFEHGPAGWARSKQSSGMQQLLSASRLRVARSKDMQWWSRPGPFFYVPSAAFWLIILWTYVQFRLQLPELRDGLTRQDKAAIPCNTAHRPVATCAHRGNAAELLRKAGAPKSAHLLQQMRLLWRAGVLCFDMDVVQLQGGDMVVGHPGDLAAQADAAKLLQNTTSSRDSALPGGSSSSSTQAARISADQLHTYSLQQLRAAGLSAQAAPTLQSVLSHFRVLIDSLSPNDTTTTSSSSSSAAVVTAQEAARRRAWTSTPVLSLEPKGPAAVDPQAFLRVAQLAAAAGVSQHTLLWLRQMPPSAGAAAAGMVVTDLARAVNKGLALTSSSNSSNGTVGAANAAGQQGRRPLLGLIVADVLLQKPHLAALQSAGDASRLTAALLAEAGGVASSSDTEEDAASAVLDAFDVLAPSIKLPPRVLHSFVSDKPCLAWTLEDEGHTRRGLWLGIDVAITNTPMAQLDIVRQEEGTVCNS